MYRDYDYAVLQKMDLKVFSVVEILKNKLSESFYWNTLYSQCLSIYHMRKRIK